MSRELKYEYQAFNDVRYYKSQDGYYRSGATKERCKAEFIHRDIWKHFNGEIPEGFIVHHVDGDQANNSIENLALMSRADHVLEHAMDKGYLLKDLLCDVPGCESPAFTKLKCKKHYDVRHRNKRREYKRRMKAKAKKTVLVSHI
jgi:hypothetical protein